MSLPIIQRKTNLGKAQPLGPKPNPGALDIFEKPNIINENIMKYCDEDEYAPSRRYRERGHSEMPKW
jgi:hypothetical protein